MPNTASFSLSCALTSSNMALVIAAYRPHWCPARKKGEIKERRREEREMD